MSTHERRQHERKRVAGEILGEFQITIDGKTYPILDVKDVSISGVGIAFAHKVEANTNIRLNFNAADLKLAINGRVAWCIENRDPLHDVPATDAFKMGIEFDAKTADHNCLLFMAVRKYLDDFE